MKERIIVWKDKKGRLQPSNYVSDSTPTFMVGDQMMAVVNITPAGKEAFRSRK